MEMNNKLIPIVLAIVVGIIVLGSVLMPVLKDTTEVYRTFDNGGYFTYDAIQSSEDSRVIAWDHTTPGVISVDGVTIQMPSGIGSWTIVGSENLCLRYYTSAATTGVQCYGTAGYLSANIATGTDATITVSDSEVIFAKTGGTSATTTYPIGTHGFAVNGVGAGALTLKYSNESAFVLTDTEIYLCGTTMVTGSGTNDFVGVYGYGSLDDGLTLSTFYGAGAPNVVSFGDVTATYSEVDGYKELCKLDKFEFPITQNSATVTATYSYFVVPSEVTAERVNHLNSGEISILGAIPVMIIVAMLFVAVSAINKKND